MGGVGVEGGGDSVKEKDKESKAGVGEEEEEKIRPYRHFRALLSLSFP